MRKRMEMRGIKIADLPDVQGNQMKLKEHGLTEKEFFTLACRFADSTNTATAKKWWDAFYEVLIRELFFNGTCKVPNVGTFSTKEFGEYLQKQKDINGKEIIYTVPARQVPYFDACDQFINDVNMMGVTKAYRRRLKQGMLTSSDYERQIRAESLGVVGSLSEERIEKAKEAFKEVLKKKKELKKGKVKPEDEED